MSLRRFIPFSSNSSVKTGKGTMRSRRPPTYTSIASATPTYLSQATTGANEENSCVEWDNATSSTSDAASDQTERAPPMGGGTDPRYIYYRIYTEHGAVPTANPVYANDPYLGRILAKLVAPPHTAMNLKNCISAFENIPENTPTSLFISASSQAPMDDSGRVSILRYPGPGGTSHEPLALLAKLPPASRRPLKVSLRERAPQRSASFEARHIYYQIFKKHRAIALKHPAHPTDPHVGCILVNIIPPPHTAASIMRCISKAESLDLSSAAQLFPSILSESPFGEGHVSILTSDCPGSTPGDPMAVVDSPDLPRIQVITAVETAMPVGPATPVESPSPLSVAASPTLSSVSESKSEDFLPSPCRSKRKVPKHKLEFRIPGRK